MARNFDGAIPIDATRPSSFRMSPLIAFPMAWASPNRRSEPVTSRNASSRDRGSTSGVYRWKIPMIWRLTRVYLSKSAGSRTSSGQSRSARAVGMAECTPNSRAS